MTRSLIFFLLLIIPFTSMAADDGFVKLRLRLVEELRVDARHAGRALDRKVLDVLARVPRHEFVPPEFRHLAYRNHPLPIGYGQTISQPFIVALMTDLLDIKSDDVVLEIGTGSGYQAAVLAELAAQVYTIEIVRALGEGAGERLKRLGYENVHVRVADGYYGWKEYAPFDAIIVTCAAGHVPPPLVEQLRPGGRMVIPIGGAYDVQILMVITKSRSGALKTRQVIPVRFVPMTGRAQTAR